MNKNMRQYSHVNQENNEQDLLQRYVQIDEQYKLTGLTYRAMNLIQEIQAKSKGVDSYILMLDVVKIYHFNQFQIIFFGQILDKTKDQHNNPQETYNRQSQMFEPNQEFFSERLNRLIGKIISDDLKKEQNQAKQTNEKYLKRSYLYYLAVAYLTKQGLNGSEYIKIYDMYLKQFMPKFFSTLIEWIQKFGNKAFAADPSNKIHICLNEFFIQLEQTDQKQQKKQEYRNYNQIVSILITQNRQLVEKILGRVKKVIKRENKQGKNPLLKQQILPRKKIKVHED